MNLNDILTHPKIKKAVGIGSTILILHSSSCDLLKRINDEDTLALIDLVKKNYTRLKIGYTDSNVYAISALPIVFGEGKEKIYVVEFIDVGLNNQSQDEGVGREDALVLVYSSNFHKDNPNVRAFADYDFDGRPDVVKYNGKPVNPTTCEDEYRTHINTALAAARKRNRLPKNMPRGFDYNHLKKI